MTEKTITEEIVNKKIRDAGWMVMIFAILIFIFGIFFSITTLLMVIYSGTNDVGIIALFPLAILAVGGAIYHFANKLYKTKLPIKTAQLYLIVFTIIFIPFIGGLIGLIVIWHTGAALLAIRNYNTQGKHQ